MSTPSTVRARSSNGSRAPGWFLEPLSADERAEFLKRYESRIADAYPAQPDGKVLLRFPRLFFVAQRR
jgi:trans-aconitate 2-methyltransferase